MCVVGVPSLFWHYVNQLHTYSKQHEHAGFNCVLARSNYMIFKSIRYATIVTSFLFLNVTYFDIPFKALSRLIADRLVCARCKQLVIQTERYGPRVSSQYDEYRRIQAENDKCCKCSFKVDTIQSDFVVSVLRNCQMRHNNENLKRRSCVKYPVHKFQSFSQIYFGSVQILLHIELHF